LGALCLWTQVGTVGAQQAEPVAPSPVAIYPKSPAALFGELYAAVQNAPVFSDGKLFSDAVPKSAPSDILAQYRAARPDSTAALKEFVVRHFILPGEAGAPTGIAEHATITQHIDGLWDILTRATPEVPAYGSMLSLPQPYVVPGGRFREIYYWDSYFTMLGLKESGRQDLVESMVCRTAPGPIISAARSRPSFSRWSAC
jgi:alpha,alpha-trehalase